MDLTQVIFEKTDHYTLAGKYSINLFKKPLKRHEAIQLILDEGKDFLSFNWAVPLSKMQINRSLSFITSCSNTYFCYEPVWGFRDHRHVPIGMQKSIKQQLKNSRNI